MSFATFFVFAKDFFCGIMILCESREREFLSIWDDGFRNASILCLGPSHHPIFLPCNTRKSNKIAFFQFNSCKKNQYFDDFFVKNIYILIFCESFSFTFLTEMDTNFYLV